MVRAGPFSGVSHSPAWVRGARRNALAAGNDNTNACNGSPARVAAAITVGSTTSTDARSSFSNYGTCVDIFAPGSSITSSWYTSTTATNTMSGTSMATLTSPAWPPYLAANPSATPAQVASAIVSSSTSGRVTSPGTGSPNRLLYSLLGAAPPPPPPPTDTALANGGAVAVSDSTVGSTKFFYIDVPAGAANLTINLSGGSGDADMYVRFNAKPTTSTYYDCRPYLNGNSENCSISSPSAGRWWVMLNAYSAYSGASLKATYTTGGGGGCTTHTGSLSSGASAYVPTRGGYASSVSGTHTGVLTGPAGTDFDLYLQKLSGTTWSNVAQGITANPNESVTYNGTAGTYRWRVVAYSGSGSYSV